MKRKKSKKGLIITLSIVLALIVAGVLYFKVYAGETEAPQKTERQYNVEKGNITVGIDADGKLEAKNVGYFASGGTIIDKLLVKPGQRVKSGDPLAELSVAEANKNYEKYKEAYEKVEDALEDMKEEKEDYLLSLNWLLENQKDESYNTYIDKYWELKDQIWSLENNIYEAENKKEWSDQGELMEGSINELNKELEAKKAELEKLEADREKQKEDENNLGLQKELQEKKVREYDEKIEALNNQLNEARGKMEKAKSRFIYADKDGIVLKVNNKDGEEAKDGQPIVEIGDLSEMYIKLIVDPESISDIEEGQQVEFFVEAYPEKVFTGEVTAKNLVQNSEGKYEVTVKVHETDSELLDGMGAGATIIIKQKKDVLTLPNKVITLENGKQYVKVKNSEGELVPKEITAGFSDGRTSEIVSGLNEGDAVFYED